MTDERPRVQPDHAALADIRGRLASLIQPLDSSVYAEDFPASAYRRPAGPSFVSTLGLSVGGAAMFGPLLRVRGRRHRARGEHDDDLEHDWGNARAPGPNSRGWSAVAVEQLRCGELLRSVPQNGRIEGLLQAMTDSPYFEGIDRPVLRQLASVSIVHRYRKNQVLFVEGEASRTLYFILSGRVKMYRLSHDGRERIVNMLGQGELWPRFRFAMAAVTLPALKLSSMQRSHCSDGKIFR